MNTARHTVTELSGNRLRVTGVATGADFWDLSVSAGGLTIDTEMLTSVSAVTPDPVTVEIHTASGMLVAGGASVALSATVDNETSREWSATGGTFTFAPSVEDNEWVAPAAQANIRTYTLTLTAQPGNESDSITVRVMGTTPTTASVTAPDITVEAGSSGTGTATSEGLGASPNWTKTSGPSWVGVTGAGFGQADVDADPPAGTAAGDYDYTIRAIGNGEDESDTGTVTVTDGIDPPDPCENASVTAPDLSAPLGGSDSGAAAQSGFPSGSGIWTVTEQPGVGVVSVSSNGTVSWDAPSSQPSPGDSTDYAVQYERGGCTAEGGGTVMIEGVVDPCAGAQANVSSTSETVAPGDRVVLVFSHSGFPGSGGSWDFSSTFGPADGVVSDFLGIVTVDIDSFAEAGDHTITGTYTQGGCSASVLVDITIT